MSGKDSAIFNDEFIDSTWPELPTLLWKKGGGEEDEGKYYGPVKY